MADSLNGKISFHTHPLDIFRNSCATAKPLYSWQQKAANPSSVFHRLCLHVSSKHLHGATEHPETVSRDAGVAPPNTPQDAHMHLPGLHFSSTIVGKMLLYLQAGHEGRKKGLKRFAVARSNSRQFCLPESNRAGAAAPCANGHGQNPGNTAHLGVPKGFSFAKKKKKSGFL